VCLLASITKPIVATAVTRILSPAFVDLATREVTTGGLGALGGPARDEHYAIGWGKPGPASPASPASFGDETVGAVYAADR
jgi:hypothetical protein